MAVPELLRLAVAYYRSPLNYPHLSEPDYRVPAGLDVCLQWIGQQGFQRQLIEYANSLSTTPSEVREALLFFIKKTMLEQEGDPLKTLGLVAPADAAAVKRHYRLLIRFFHPDREEVKGSWNSVYAGRVTAAYNRLRQAGELDHWNLRQLQQTAGARVQPPASAHVRATTVSRSPGAVVVGATHLHMAGYRLEFRGLERWRERPRTMLAILAGLVLVSLFLFSLGGHREELAELSAADPGPPEPASVRQTWLDLLPPTAVPPVDSGQREPRPVAEATGVDYRVRYAPPQRPIAADRPVDRSSGETAADATDGVALPSASLIQRLTLQVAQYVAAYETGDSAALASLFDPLVVTSEYQGMQALLADYRAFFRNTDERHLILKNLDWKQLRPGQFSGEADYVAEHWRLGEQSVAPIRRQSGRILFSLSERPDGRMLFDALRHHPEPED